MTCGHHKDYRKLCTILIDNNFEESMTQEILSIVQSHYNCIGLSCDDMGFHRDAALSTPNALIFLILQDLGL